MASTADIESIARDLERLISSRRLRIGNTIGDLLQAFSRRRGTRADVQLTDMVKTLRETSDPAAARLALREVNQLLRSLEKSRRWRAGQLVGSVLTLNRKRSEPVIRRLKRQIPRVTKNLAALSEAPVWGVTRRGNLAELERIYAEYLHAVEPVTRARLAANPGERVQVVLDARAPRPDLGTDIVETLRAIDSPLIDVAVVCHPDRPLHDLPKKIHRIETRLLGPDGLAPAIDSSSARYVLFLEPGDVVAAELCNGLGTDGARDAIVLDHDHLDRAGNRSNPQFKPSYSPDFLLEVDYIGRGVAFSRAALRQHWDKADPEEPIRDLVLRIAETGGSIGKVDGILVHLGAQASTPIGVTDLADRVLQRRGVAGRLEWTLGRPHIRYLVPDEPLVSIIIPFRDQAEMLEDCVKSILSLSTWDRFEVLLVDNQSRDPVTGDVVHELTRDPRVRLLRWDRSFNYSAANNWAAREALGEYLIFLNNDTVVLSPDWIQELLGYAAQPHIGAVGGKLYYANGRIQHGGVVIGLNGLAGHLFSGIHEVTLDPLYTSFVRDCSAVTAACLAIARDKFESIGGFDTRLQLTGSDVDLCLRLRSRSLHTLWNPKVQLLHYEKATRKQGSALEADKHLSKDRYEQYLISGDPFYNAELSYRSTRRLPRTSAESRPTDSVEPLQLRGSRTDFVKQYDITPKDLELNTAVLESFALHRAVNPRRIVWFVPPFDNPYRGGIHTILRLADAFTRHAGSRSEIVVYERFDGLMEFADADRVKARVTEAFPTLNFDLHHLRTASEVAGLGTSDIAFATLWTGAYHLLRYNQTVGKFYLVQDYEPAFQGANSVGALAEQTYRFGFDGIANTPGVASHYKSYGNHTTVLFPGVDHLLFRPPRTPKNPEEPLSIVFYGRPQRERNGFELGIEALRRVKEQFGKNVVIRSVGAKYDLAKFGLEDVLANLGVLPDLQSVARLYRQSDIGLVFMFTAHPSYQPLEYMASGCVTVTNINESNAWLLRDNENALVVPPSPAMVAGAISELIGDADLRRRLAAAGIDTVQEFYWEPQLERAVQWVVSGARE